MPRVKVNKDSRDELVETGVKAADVVGASAGDGAEAARQAAQAGARAASSRRAAADRRSRCWPRP